MNALAGREDGDPGVPEYGLEANRSIVEESSLGAPLKETPGNKTGPTWAEYDNESLARESIRTGNEHRRPRDASTHARRQELSNPRLHRESNHVVINQAMRTGCQPFAGQRLGHPRIHVIGNEGPFFRAGVQRVRWTPDNWVVLRQRKTRVPITRLPYAVGRGRDSEKKIT